LVGGQILFFKGHHKNPQCQSGLIDGSSLVSLLPLPHAHPRCRIQRCRPQAEPIHDLMKGSTGDTRRWRPTVTGTAGALKLEWTALGRATSSNRKRPSQTEDRRTQPRLWLGRFTQLVASLNLNRGGSTWVRAEPVCGGATRAAAGGEAWDPNRGFIICWCLLRCVGR
jgi:hypothetical protein